jgi:hypothetical protein
MRFKVLEYAIFNAYHTTNLHISSLLAIQNRKRKKYKKVI